MKRIFIIISLLFFVACQSGYKGGELIVTQKEFSRLEEYKYYYKLEGDYEGRNWACSEIKTETLYVHSNQDWNVGNTIPLGARWGKKQGE